MTTCHEAISGDAVLVVSIDHPPVNALATRVRRCVHEALQRAATDPRVRAVVLTGNERLFSAGADLGEFADGTAMDRPSLHADIIPMMASMTKPVVAAVRGVALGGGFELALGCHDRVFASGTTVGLPETTLGLMPGAGGTQLLPRAIGLARAADLIVAGRVVPIEALDGPALAHAIVPTDELVETAMRRASQLAALPTPFRAIADRPVVDPEGEALLRQLAARYTADPDTLPGVLRALDAIVLTTSTTIADGMRAEFAMFEPLLASVESRALRHVFLAERRRKPDADVARFEREFVERIDARIGRESAALARAGVDPDTIARTIARWRSHAAEPGAHDTSIATRLLGAMIDEGHDLLEAGGATSEADLDLALVRSGRFARVRGGPFFQARMLRVERLPEVR